MGKYAKRSVQERIRAASGRRLMRVLQRKGAESLIEMVQRELLRRILAAVLPMLLRRFGLSSWDAEEVAMETARVILSEPARYNARLGSVETLARRIAYCDAVNLRERQKRRAIPTVSLDELEEVGEFLAAAARQEKLERPEHQRPDPRRRRFQKCFRLLPSKHRRILLLRASGVGNKEIAHQLNMTPGAVATAYCRYRARLAQTLK